MNVEQSYKTENSCSGDSKVAYSMHENISSKWSSSFNTANCISAQMYNWQYLTLLHRMARNRRVLRLISSIMEFCLKSRNSSQFISIETMGASDVVKETLALYWVWTSVVCRLCKDHRQGKDHRSGDLDSRKISNRLVHSSYCHRNVKAIDRLKC